MSRLRHKPRAKVRVTDTARGRRLIQQLVRNVFPRCDARSIESPTPNSLSFEIIDETGCVRASPIRILSHHTSPITKSWLLRAVRYARGPDGGKPRLG